MHTFRDKFILLLFLPIFFGNSFYLTYYAQEFSQSFIIFLQVKLRI